MSKTTAPDTVTGATPEPGAALGGNGIAQPVVVTGATGFIGRRLVARLLSEGNAVRALVLPQEKTDGLWPGAVGVVRGDVTSKDAVDAAVQGAGTVFHLAAVVGDWGAEELFQRITVGGTENVLSAAAEAGARAVLASSIVAYGDALGRAVCDEDLPLGHALGPYSRSKQAQERIARELGTRRGLEFTVIRPANVYGPGSKPWVHDVVAQLRSGLPSIIGSGEQNAGLCHVDNAVDVFVRAAATPGAAGRTYNASDGSDVTWGRYMKDLAQMCGAKPPKRLPWVAAKAGAYAYETLWRLLGKSERPAITHEALNIVGSHHRVPIERARRELGYVPRVAYDEGLRTVAEYMAQAKL